MGQRYIPLTYSQSGNTLTVAAPANINIAPPGYYMLFIIDDNGVPSVAKIVNITAAPDPEPDPVLIKAAEVSVESSSTISVPISIDPNGSGLDVGAIELRLRYNQNVVAVTGCTLNGFSGACNADTPGVVAIAGARAESTGTESVLANLNVQAVGAVGESSDVTMSVRSGLCRAVTRGRRRRALRRFCYRHRCRS